MLLPKSGIDVKSKNKPVKGDKGGKGGEGAGKKKEEKYNQSIFGVSSFEDSVTASMVVDSINTSRVDESVCADLR